MKITFWNPEISQLIGLGEIMYMGLIEFRNFRISQIVEENQKFNWRTIPVDGHSTSYYKVNLQNERLEPKEYIYTPLNKIQKLTIVNVQGVIIDKTMKYEWFWVWTRYHQLQSR